ncbi:CheR family methyltransferase [Allocoleopsis franciscana]|uniref:protein-glutamate O-methyltransferase n=1 Tax=Allocoleopsis franciscana PCC 7113 TaxID=1173027 RepID=K9WGI3_9CYAN|nr:CheR family methyltransferase [Allocoleopsis franciscana]AFZ19308.1 methylase of chemotaxis methyl-accepting protein [Allocoleopsis franciscana PCC 7113]
MAITPDDPTFEVLLHYLKQTRGFDFTGYKRPSLMRLAKKRMQIVGAESFTQYLDYLEANPLELNHLFDALLLNVTTFFRDLPAWNYLTQEIIPRILEMKPDNELIRVWTAGCASGEEAYTIAIILAEILGEEAFRSRVKIYATDLDEDAITYGRLATYTARQLGNIPEPLREKYFEVTRSAYIFRHDLRRCVIFGRNNLVQDAPIGHLDLLICRNTLMYFNAETQSRVLARFHFALKDRGFLFVGKAEMLLTHANLFTPVNLKYRIFAKLSHVTLRDRQFVLAEAGNTEIGNHTLRNIRLRDEAIESLPIAQIVVDIHGKLAIANRQARIWFNISNSDLERPLQDLEVSYRPAELRSLIQKAYTERRPIQLNHVEFSKVGESNPIWLDIEILPLMDTQGELLGVLVVFQDATRYNQLQQELSRSTQEVETAYEELQSANEELETTNEELQSTNEELETTNEELQSTNEELETINEELQSSNEELQATNDELRARTDELNCANAFLESILTSLQMGMVVLNNRLSVQLWNGEAVNLWGIPASEVEGYFFFDLDLGLPLEQLREPVRECQTGVSNYRDMVLDAINRRGRAIRCRVICTPLIVAAQQQGIILLMEDVSNKQQP